MFTSMFGVVLLTMPELLFPWLKTADQSEDKFDEKDLYPYYNLGILVALSGGISSGFSYLAMRKMKGNVCPEQILFWFGGSNCMVCFILIMILSDPLAASPLNFKSLCLLLLCGFFTWLANAFAVKALTFV